jgi:splicing factor 3B subunit 2
VVRVGRSPFFVVFSAVFHTPSRRDDGQGKRGIEKPPFELPEYIAATGITKLRETAREMDEKKKLKSKTRDRVQPKRGRIEIDYQVLHDAFFRYQTKPKLSKPGDL